MTGRCQESEPGEQEEVERDQLEAGTVGWAGPGFPGFAGFGLVQHISLLGINLLVDRKSVV